MGLMIARFLLSRLESLSAAPTSLSFLRFRSKSSKSSEGGQDWSLRAQRRDCVICSVPLSLLSTNPTASPDTRLKVMALSCLMNACARAGKTLISRLHLHPSGSCRALTGLPAHSSGQISERSTTFPKPDLHRRAHRILTYARQSLPQ